MHTIRLKLDKRSYAIIVGKNILPQLGSCLKKLDIGDSAYIITNSLIRNKYGSRLAGVLKKSKFSFKVRTIPDTEKSKSIAMLSSVINDLAKFDLNKRTFIIAFGGGVVGDLSGLIASIYKRGIPYIQVPTTLLAQVDSAIGGKTAVDLKVGKNLIGAFYQPRLVFSDVEVLKSLKVRQLRSGLAEIIKYGIIRKSPLFAYLEKEYKGVLKAKTSCLEYVVNASSKIKADIVQQDERDEQGVRITLNFGHTLGHAIEAAFKFKRYTHGEAVALGMLIVLDISRDLALINDKLNTRVGNLIRQAGLPLHIDRIPLKDIIKAIYRDKKFIGSMNRLVLLKGLGKPKVMENVPLKAIEAAVKKRIK